VIVVGLGAIGSAACLQLAASGVSVIGIDPYAPPHPWGSTHGDSRITRVAIGEGREYVPLVRRSHELWRELEQMSGARLLTRSGIVILAQPLSRFLRLTRASAREYAIEHEDLSTGEVRARFPMFAVEEQTEAYYEPEAGYLRPEAAVAAQLEFASRAGAWIGELFPEGRDIFAVYRQLLYWFPIREGYPIVSACSGHGFKHPPAIGEAVAQWLTGHQPDIDLTAFSFSQARQVGQAPPAVA